MKTRRKYASLLFIWPSYGESFLSPMPLSAIDICRENDINQARLMIEALLHFDRKNYPNVLSEIFTCVSEIILGL